MDTGRKEELKERAKRIVSSLSTEEKAGLCSGSDDWHMPGIEKAGLGQIFMTDGPHGVRSADNGEKAGEAIHSTCFTALATAACSFDTELMEEAGNKIAEECQEYGVPMLLGPGCNIKRTPLCGRNFEYLSEDPVLAGKMAAGLVRGVQDKGVGATVKHFACNNQESFRMISDSIVDERALREIYLKPFEIAINEGNAANVMCSYNKINGTYVSDSKKYLTDILRDEMGFDGLVVSDWGAMNNWVASVEAGLDLAMPGLGLETRKSMLTDAVKKGTLSTQALDRAAEKVVFNLLMGKEMPCRKYDRKAHDTFVGRMAAESAVLLENNGILPLKKEMHLAVIGAFAKIPRFQGAGSSQTKPNHVTSVCDVLDREHISYLYSEGVGMEQIKADMVKIKAAVDTAKKADLAVIFAGIPDSFESESGDRANIEMPESYLELISHLVSEKIPVVVVLMGGSVMDLPFRKDVDALLLAGLTGQNNGTAVCDLLFGKKNPSGRLAETWPMKEKMQKLTDFGKRDVKYTESIYVGYRYYDKTGTAVAYPFGYGLSYTAFEYSNMKLSTHMLVAGEEVTVTVKVKNTGDRSGKEVVQIYVSAPETTLFKAKWELKGFTKTPELKPGESCPVEVKLQAEELQYYNVKAKKWHLESGAYRIAVCRNSRTVLCEQKLEVRGETGITVPDYRKEAPEYYSIQEGAEFSEEQFQGIYGRAFPEEFQARPFHMNSTIGDVLQLKWIAKLYRRIEPKLIDSLVSMGGMSEEEKAQMDTKAAQMLIRNVMDGLPLRNLINLSKGKIGVKGVKRLIWILNLLGGRKKETGK